MYRSGFKILMNNFLKMKYYCYEKIEHLIIYILHPPTEF